MKYSKCFLVEFIFFFFSKSVESEKAIKSFYRRYYKVVLNAKYLQQFKLYLRRNKRFLECAFLLLFVYTIWHDFNGNSKVCIFLLLIRKLDL